MTEMHFEWNINLLLKNTLGLLYYILYTFL